MKTIKIKVIVIGIVGIFLCLTGQAWSEMGFVPAPGDECCLVDNPGAGALAIKGTVAVVLDRIDPDPDYPQDRDSYYSIDATLRLERSGDVHFFRLNIPVRAAVLEANLSDPTILCLILNPLESEGASSADPLEYGIVARERVKDFVNNILNTFFPDSYSDPELDPWELARLVITQSSISDAMGIFQCESPAYPSPNYELCRIPDTVRWASLGNVTIHVVDEDKVRFTYPAACEWQE